MTIVFTNGCFDILHAGHVQLLERARALGDKLIVGINTDETIKTLKGRKRPINILANRIYVLSSIRWVDHVIAFDEINPVELVKKIRPDILVKGPGYSRDNMPEAKVAEEWGARVVILDGPEISTTKILEKLNK